MSPRDQARVRALVALRDNGWITPEQRDEMWRLMQARPSVPTPDQLPEPPVKAIVVSEDARNMYVRAIPRTSAWQARRPRPIRTIRTTRTARTTTAHRSTSGQRRAAAAASSSRDDGGGEPEPPPALPPREVERPSDGWTFVAKLITRDLLEGERRRELQRQHDLVLLMEIAAFARKPVVPGRRLEAVAR